MINEDQKKGNQKSGTDQSTNQNPNRDTKRENEGSRIPSEGFEGSTGNIDNPRKSEVDSDSDLENDVERGSGNTR